LQLRAAQANSLKDPISKNNQSKNGLEAWLKQMLANAEALNEFKLPSPTNKKKKNRAKTLPNCGFHSVLLCF
jgi:formiminotetrahydrofolate cyclodeaminase